MRPDESVVLRPIGSRVLAVALAALIALGAGISLREDPAGTLPWLGAGALVIVAAWAVLWQPAVIVGTETLGIRNILRSHEIPWTAIEQVDTKWTFSVIAGGRKISAWASPAPGAMQQLTLDKRGFSHLPDSAYLDGTVKLTDDPKSHSGLAALHARRRLEALEAQAEESGATPPTEAGTVRTRWHAVTIACLAVLAVSAFLPLLR